MFFSVQSHEVPGTTYIDVIQEFKIEIDGSVKCACFLVVFNMRNCMHTLYFYTTRHGQGMKQTHTLVLVAMQESQR